MKEEYILTASLEPTSEPYALAKIAGIKMCQAYRRQYGFNAIVMIPATIYGPQSDTNIETAHVIGALLGKFRDALANGKSEVTVWGSGKPRREFLYVDDFVEAALFLMENYNGEAVVNAGCGEDVSITDLAQMIKAVTGYSGQIVYDASKPDGTIQKLLDNSRIAKLGWKAKVHLREGIHRMYEGHTKSARM